MRIAHVITRMIIGGAQENTLLTCRELLHWFGDDVLLITGPPLGPEGSLMPRVEQEGVPHVVLPPLRREIHPGRDLRGYFSVKQALREFAPDVVHTHSAKGGVLGRAAGRATGAPAVVHTVHGAPFHPYQGRAGRRLSIWAERWAARRCDKLVSVADAMTQLLVDARVAPAEKFVTVYSGMETAPFLHADEHRTEMRRRLGYEQQHVVIGKIARLFHLKGHGYLIRAAGEIVRRHPHARFLLVGDGLLRQQLEQQAAAAGLTDFVRFAGLSPPEEIPAWLAAMDVVTHVSLREGLARVLPQALLAGKPVVSYDIDGAREVVIPDQTGFLLPPESLDELTDSLCRLIEDPQLRRRLGEEGRRRFTQQFCCRTMAEKLRLVYEEVLKSAR